MALTAHRHRLRGDGAAARRSSCASSSPTARRSSTRSPRRRPSATSSWSGAEPASTRTRRRRPGDRCSRSRSLIPWVAGIVLRAARRPPRARSAGCAVGGARREPRRARRAGRRRARRRPGAVVTGDWPAGVGITLRADALGVVFALLSSVALLAALVHEVLDGVRERVVPGAGRAARRRPHRVFLTGDLFNFYVFFELSMTAVVRPGGLRRRRAASWAPRWSSRPSTCSARSCSCSSVAGALPRHRHAGHGADRASAWRDVDPNAAILIAVGFFVAFSVKLGLFPFHFWLPTVYTRRAARGRGDPRAAALANIGAYGLLRFGGEMLPARARARRVGADRDRLRVDPVRRRCWRCRAARRGEMLAYSAIGQVGYILVAHRHRRAGRLRGGDPLHDRQRAQQDAAVPDRAHARRAGRRGVRRRRAQRRRHPARRRLRRQARAVPRRGRTARR